MRNLYRCFTLWSQKLVMTRCFTFKMKLLSYSSFYLDILVIGVGDPGQQVSHKMIKYMKDKKINLEISPTERACAIFNFLNVEGRCVAGAMIPPTKYRINEDDIASTQRRNRSLLKLEENQII